MKTNRMINTHKNGWMRGQMDGWTDAWGNRIITEHVKTLFWVSLDLNSSQILTWLVKPTGNLTLPPSTLTSSRCSGVDAVKGYISVPKPRCLLFYQSCSWRWFWLALPPCLVGLSLPLKNLFPHLVKDQVPPAVNIQGHPQCGRPQGMS